MRNYPGLVNRKRPTSLKLAAMGRPPDSCPEGTSDCRYRPAIWYDSFRDLGVELASIEEEVSDVFSHRGMVPRPSPSFLAGMGRKGGPLPQCSQSPRRS